MENKPITLRNPKGEARELWDWEYYELILKFAATRRFREWSSRRNVAGEVKVNGATRVSVTAVEMFLRESGYVKERKELDFKNCTYGKEKDCQKECQGEVLGAEPDAGVQ